MSMDKAVKMIDLNNYYWMVHNTTITNHVELSQAVHCCFYDHLRRTVILYA